MSSVNDLLRERGDLPVDTFTKVLSRSARLGYTDADAELQPTDRTIVANLIEKIAGPAPKTAGVRTAGTSQQTSDTHCGVCNQPFGLTKLHTGIEALYCANCRVARVPPSA